MESNAPLDRYPLLRTNSPEELEHLMTRYGATRFDQPAREADFFVKGNHFDLGRVGIFYCQYDAPFVLGFPGDDIIRWQITLAGTAETAIAGDRGGVSVDEGFLAPSGEPVTYNFGPRYAQLVVRIKQDAMTNTLESTIGAPARAPIRFQPVANHRRPALQSLRRMIDFVTSELDRGDWPLPDVALAEFEDMFLATLLRAQPHNFSDLLDRPGGRALPWQVRRVEEYIAANWDRPVTIEALVGVTGASARSIFKAFRDGRGYSPMEFAKRMRLEHARRQLAGPDDGTSVGRVARTCGFGNLGHFARDYLRAFGELPSETLNRGRSMPHEPLRA